ncbi:hypothetical protein Tco_0245430 [Tanacetum coccineum]
MNNCTCPDVSSHEKLLNPLQQEELGNGLSTLFWDDVWCEGASLRIDPRAHSERRLNSLQVRVSESDLTLWCLTQSPDSCLGHCTILWLYRGFVKKQDRFAITIRKTGYDIGVLYLVMYCDVGIETMIIVLRVKRGDRERRKRSGLCAFPFWFGRRKPEKFDMYEMNEELSGRVDLSKRDAIILGRATGASEEGDWTVVGGII